MAIQPRSLPPTKRLPALLAIAIYHITFTTLFRRLAINLLKRRAFVDAKTA